jgi:SAM-dependent methyltransferase
MSVFNSVYAGQYDQLYAAKDYDQECRLALDAAARHKHKVESILDIGCGTGGHALRLAKQGFDVTGVDASASMLEEAKLKSASLKSGKAPNWLLGDARDFRADGAFDLAIMMFAVFSYMQSNDDQMAVLANIRKHLKPGGMFLCDFWYGPAVLTERPGERIRDIPIDDGKRVIRSAKTTIDTYTHTADVTFKLWTLEGQKILSETEETHRMRFVFPQEFIRLLSLNGFELLSLTSFPTLDEPATDHTWNVFAVARAR